MTSTSQLLLNPTTACPYPVGFDMGAGNMIDYNDDDVLEAQGCVL